MPKTKIFINNIHQYKWVTKFDWVMYQMNCTLIASQLYKCGCYIYIYVHIYIQYILFKTSMLYLNSINQMFNIDQKKSLIYQSQILSHDHCRAINNRSYQAIGSERQIFSMSVNKTYNQKRFRQQQNNQSKQQIHERWSFTYPGVLRQEVTGQ